MEKSQLIINSLKKEILTKNTRIQSLNYKLNTETNEYYLEELEEDINKEKKNMTVLIKKLNEQVISVKKEKAIYKKSFNKMKDSLIEFAKVSRNNDKLKKASIDINNIMIIMERYLNS